jgi:AcrR family transcriptional regulator
MEQLGRKGRPRERDREQIEERLIAQAAKLFFEKGYGHTTMAAVASAAKVSNTTLYARFPSKPSLFAAMVTQEVSRWNSGDLQTPIDPDCDVRTLLMSFGRIVLRAGSTTQSVQLNRLLFSESGRFAELSDVARMKIVLGVDWLAGALVRHAEHQGMPCTRAQETARMFLNGLSGWLGQHILADHRPSRQEQEEYLEQAVAQIMAAGLDW